MTNSSQASSQHEFFTRFPWGTTHSLRTLRPLWSPLPAGRTRRKPGDHKGRPKGRLYKGGGEAYSPSLGGTEEPWWPVAAAVPGGAVLPHLAKIGGLGFFSQFNCYC